MRTAAMVLLATLLTGASGAAAQRRQPSGLWYSVAVAPGWARVTCDICAGRRTTGLSAFGGVGGSTGRGLRVGAELAGWRQRDGGVTQTLLSFGGAAYSYPNVRRQFYLRGGATFSLHRVNDGTDVVTSSGIGPQLGIGYEYPVTPSWRIAPFAHYSVGVFGGDVKFNGGQAAGSATVSFFQVGASLIHR